MYLAVEKVADDNIAVWTGTVAFVNAYASFKGTLDTIREKVDVQKDFYLIKTDSQGNEQWYEKYGGSGNEGGQDIMLLSDGNYLLTGGGSDNGVNSYGRLIKVTPTGGELWNRDYIMQNGNSLFDVLELSDGTLVATGLTTISSEGNAGWLIKTDGDGNLLWQRKYNKNNQTDLFYGVLATEDGGFLLSGQAINEDNNTQDAWLLKVDSIGCPYPNCTVGIDELGTNEIIVDVWPNPVSEVLNVELIDFSASVEMTVFDIQGRVITPSAFGHSPLKKGGELLRWDVNGWASGIYILKGTDDVGRSFSIKFVKE